MKDLERQQETESRGIKKKKREEEEKTRRGGREEKSGRRDATPTLLSEPWRE